MTITLDDQSTAREHAIKHAPPSARNVMKRAYSGTSRTAGVKAYCLHCVGYVRADVRNCSSLACPLWEYRPFQRDDSDDDDTTEPTEGTAA
jgi:hypothetical protein